jgi:hypothetical protein
VSGRVCMDAVGAVRLHAAAHRHHRRWGDSRRGGEGRGRRLLQQRVLQLGEARAPVRPSSAKPLVRDERRGDNGWDGRRAHSRKFGVLFTLETAGSRLERSNLRL